MNRADRKLFNREMIAYMNLDKKWFEKYQALAAELEAVKRERDALMHDLRIVGNNSFSVCVVCKHGDPCAVACQRADVDCLEWRGLCAENGGAEDGT